jgi:predicted amidohydrolase
VKVAAYQAPLLPQGSTAEAVGLIQRQLERCEAEGVEILCCPETVLGGLADDPGLAAPVALGVENGELAVTLAPLAGSSITLIVGFTERDPSGRFFNSAAVVERGQVRGVYRKVYPGYRTAYSAGDQLPVFTRGTTKFGIVICNDANYLEPARVLAAQGAALLFMPLNNALRQDIADAWRTRTRSNLIARAVENNLAVIAADVAGRESDRISYGGTAIVGQDGAVLAESTLLVVDLLIAEVQSERPPHGRGWDGSRNPAVVEAFLELWKTGREREGR